MRDSFNEINITPLTDIFLVLLIIMMVIAPMLDQQGLNAEQVKQDSKIMSVVVTSDNRFLWEGSPIESSDLEAFFTKEAKNYPDGLLIQADDDSEHGSIVRVMDCARNVGITSISLSRG